MTIGTAIYTMIKPTASKIPKNAAQPPVGFLNSRMLRIRAAGSIINIVSPPRAARGFPHPGLKTARPSAMPQGAREKTKPNRPVASRFAIIGGKSSLPLADSSLIAVSVQCQSNQPTCQCRERETNCVLVETTEAGLLCDRTENSSAPGVRDAHECFLALCPIAF